MSEKIILKAQTLGKKVGSGAGKSRKSFSKKMDSPANQILHLQRTIGNRAVHRLVKAGTIQAKLKVGPPNDKYEQEADRIADRVMSMPESKQSTVQREAAGPESPGQEEIQARPLAEQITPLVQRQVDEEEINTKLQRQTNEEEEEPIQAQLIRRQATEEEEEPVQAKLLQRQNMVEEEESLQTKLVQRQVKPEEEEEVQTKLQRQNEEVEEEEPVQAKQVPGQSPAVSSTIESGINSLRGGGQPLSASTRAYFDPRFGADFSQVRIHSNHNASAAAKSVNARAFTLGSDIFFGAGQYSPGTSSGRHLLAHELTHVVQQSPMGKGPDRHHSRVKPGGNLSGNTPQRLMRWTRSGVLGYLCGDPAGKTAIKTLKGYKVYSYTSYRIKRQFYTDASKKTKKGPPKFYDVKGYHNRGKKEIGAKITRTDAKTASTFVHETTHARQHIAYEQKRRAHPGTPPPTKKEKEYGAFIKQEKFNIRKGIKPVDPSFRKFTGGKWVADEPAIKKWVDRVYAIGPKKYYNEYIVANKVGKKGPIGPWVCP